MKLIDYFMSNQARNMIHKPVRYFDIYELHFARFLDRPVKLLEIGIENGGSLQMWKYYFGEKSHIVGIDINPKCLELNLENIYIGDQSDEQFLNSVINKENQFDIIIDDGGHHSFQQIKSFQVLYKSLSSDGVYLCEDCGTSYWPEYGGGINHPDTFIEFAKGLIDEVNYQGHKTEFTTTTDSITFYSDVVVFDKAEKKNWSTMIIGEKKI